MQQFTTLLLCIAALSRAAAQDATPAKQTTGHTPFKQVVYENPRDHATITLTGADTLEIFANGRKIGGKYSIDGKTLHADLVAPDGTGAHRLDFEMPGDGTLHNDEIGETFAAPEAMKKATEKMLEEKCLSNAKQIALGIRLYASDNNGNFPPKLDDLFPTYLQDHTLFINPFSAKKEAMGFDYYGFGGNDSDNPHNILLRSRDTTPDGKRIVVYFDSSGEIKADK
jgi:hypothetical protein